MKIGELLKRARIEKGLTLGQVGRDLFIQERLLQAMEDSNYEVISGEAYQRAYFRKYAEYLGLGDLIDRLSRSEDPESEEKEPQMNEIFGGTWDAARWTRLIVKIASIAVIITVVVLSIRNCGKAPEEIEQDPRVSGTQTLEVIPTESATPSWQIPGDTNGQATPGQLDDLAHELKLTALGSCWVTVTTPEGQLYSGEMAAGDFLRFTDLVGFHLTAGRPEVLDVELDGELIPWEPGERDMVLPHGASIFGNEVVYDQSGTENPPENPVDDNNNNG